MPKYFEFEEGDLDKIAKTSGIGRTSPEELTALRSRVAKAEAAVAEKKARAAGDYRVAGLGEVDTSQGRLGQAGSSFMRGIAGTTESILTGIGEAVDLPFEDTTAVGDVFRTMGRGAKYAGEMADIAPQYQEEFFATKLPQALGSTVPFIAAGGIAGAAARGAGLAAKGVKAAQYITPGVVGAVVGGEEQIKDMEATLGRKLTPEERKTA